MGGGGGGGGGGQNYEDLIDCQIPSTKWAQ